MEVTDLIGPALAYEQKIYCNDKDVLPGLTVLRTEEVSKFDSVVYDPVICLILQGVKETKVGDQMVTLAAGQALLVSHDLPVESRITVASADEPYVALIVSLDIAMVRSLYEQVGGSVQDAPLARSLSARSAEPKLIDALARYLALRDAPLEAQVLGPAILREIHFRLLVSPIGVMLRNLLAIDSHASRVARAIRQIRADFRSPLSVADMARTAGMSPSSFHGHFKGVTGTTPLQYLKDLRMIAARDMLREGRHSVAATSFEVGYESPTHFSRDYQRKFGLPPSKEVAASLERA